MEFKVRRLNEIHDEIHSVELENAVSRLTRTLRCVVRGVGRADEGSRALRVPTRRSSNQALKHDSGAKSLSKKVKVKLSL